MKNKAMVLESFNKPLVMRETEIPALKPGEVLIKLTASGVCGSDLHMYRGEDPRTRLPIILGHEGVGIIADISGKKNSVEGEKLQISDPVMWNRGYTCGECYYCKVLKQPSWCPNRKTMGINIFPTSEAPLTGCYSEYIILQKHADIFKLPEGLDHAALVAASCSGSTIAHAFMEAAPQPGDTVVVQGPGPLGLFAVAFAKAHGAQNIFVIGGSPSRMEICTKFGATHLLNRRETTIAERRDIVLEATHGRGADYVIECTGIPDAFVEGIELCRIGGAYVCTGYAQPLGDVVIDPFKHVVRRNIRLHGVWVSQTEHTYQALQMVLQNPDLFAQIVTHRLPLAQANEALELIAKKQALKVILQG